MFILQAATVLIGGSLGLG